MFTRNVLITSLCKSDSDSAGHLLQMKTKLYSSIDNALKVQTQVTRPAKQKF